MPGGLRWGELVRLRRRRAAHGGDLAAAAGATTRELMERTGHTSPAVAPRYQHVMADRQGAIAAALVRRAGPQCSAGGPAPPEGT
jgi:hypothetical protein